MTDSENAETPSNISAVTMPRWGLSMTEGLVGQWLVSEGDRVTNGQELVEIETDKITNVFESPVTGVLRRTIVSSGQTVPVGALLAVIGNPAIGDSEIEKFVAGFKPPEVDLADEDESALAPSESKVGNKTIRFLDSGNMDGPAVVLVHGFGGDLDNWLFIQPVLEEHYRVIIPDLPGHGGSTKNLSEGTVDELTQSVLGLLDNIGVRDAHWAGHSMGAAVVMNAAIVAKDRIKSLTLIAPVGFGDRIDGEYLDGFVFAAKRRDLKNLIKRLFFDESLVSADLLDGLLRYKRLDGVSEALTELKRRFAEGDRQTVNFEADLIGFGKPVQIIWGKQDNIIPIDDLHSRLQSIPIHMLDSAGHMVHLEKANEVSRLFSEFLEGSSK